MIFSHELGHIICGSWEEDAWDFACKLYKFKDNTVENIEELEQYLTGTINANDENKVRTLTIEWEWPYGDKTTGVITKEDEIDTTEGLKALDYTFDVEVTGVQVVPSK